MAQNIAHGVEEEIFESTFAQLWAVINFQIKDIKEACDHIHQMIENDPSFQAQ